MARPSKYSDAVAKHICDAIRIGATHEDAARSAGICADTISIWKKNKPEFAEMMKRAEAEFKVSALKIIRGAAIESWQAAAWLLERKFPDEFGRRMRQEITGANGVEFTMNIGKVNREEDKQ